MVERVGGNGFLGRRCERVEKDKNRQVKKLRNNRGRVVAAMKESRVLPGFFLN